MWTQFMDMHSGGGTKQKPYEYIYIEASEEEAKRVFYNRFGHSPDRVTCTCCGEDYSVSEEESFDELSAFHRRRDKQNVEEYRSRSDVLVIPADEIKEEEKRGSIPKQGYVWV